MLRLDSHSASLRFVSRLRLQLFGLKPSHKQQNPHNNQTHRTLVGHAPHPPWVGKENLL